MPLFFNSTVGVALAATGVVAGGTAIAPADMSMGLFAGLALFLLGMSYLSDGLKNAAGDQMRVVLEKFTKTRVTAAATGAVVTAVVQSSSVTTVLVVGFVSAGVMTLSQSVGVIMGANVGSTMTAQIVAFSVEQYAPAMIALGFFVNFVAKKDRTKHLGSILMGLGLVFFGMGMMSSSMAPLRTYQPFIDLMQSMAENPFLAILIAALFTALVQSSSATTSIIVVMAGEGLVSLEAGIAMALGANIGTCATAALSAIGKPTEAQRAAAVHVIFNVAGVLVWLPFISVLSQLTVSVSPAYPELEGVERLAAEAPRQIANANTLFNVINTVIFLFFTKQIAALAMRIVPDREPELEAVLEAEFLNEGVLSAPAIALHAARQETARLGDFATEMLEAIERSVETNKPDLLGEVQIKAQSARDLYPQIILFTSELGRTDMREADRIESQGLAIAAGELSLLCDIIERRLSPLIDTRASEDDSSPLRQLYAKIRSTLSDLTIAIRESDTARAQAIVDDKSEVIRLLDSLTESYREDRTSVTDQIRQELEAAQILRLLLMVARRAARTVLFNAAAKAEEPTAK